MYEKHVGRFTPITTPLFDILSKVVIPTGDPLQPPVSLLINCLFAIPLPKNYTYSKESVERLVDLLEQCLKAYTKDHPKLDREMVPLMLTILRLSESSDKAAKAVLAEKIFPTEKDREEVLGRGTTLPHILLGHVTNPIAANFTQTTLSIYFELADRDPQVFVTTVGFGNAAGFLAAKGIKMSESDMKKSANSGPSFAINPITGQKLDMEDVSDVPEMTDEEKEREAERLFVLFERYVLLCVLERSSSNELYADYEPRVSWTLRTPSQRPSMKAALKSCRTTMTKTRMRRSRRFWPISTLNLGFTPAVHIKYIISSYFICALSGPWVVMW